MRCKKVVVFFGMLFFVFMCAQSEAAILISEILADPAAGVAGDANGDGVSSSTQDEFVEFLNTGLTSFDLSGYLLKDALSTRHVFAPNTLLAPNSFMVVFGGGSPQFSNINWQVASSGGLSLNNTGDTVSLYDNNNILVDQIIYGNIGNQDQSIVRWPLTAESGLVISSQIPEAGGRIYSPGVNADGKPITPSATAVPEINSLLACLNFFILEMLRRRLLVKFKNY